MARLSSELDSEALRADFDLQNEGVKREEFVNSLHENKGDNAGVEEQEEIDEQESVVSTDDSMAGDEKECRVCRCPAENDRPLFSPCLCSGTIEYCHQDCLLQWLKHSKKERCELCGHRFEFTPLYADDAPTRLPMRNVVSSLIRRMATEWVPFGGRIVLALILWLFLVPLATSWLYRIWIHRSRVFLERLTLTCVWNDCISGLIVAAAIILSFLSLMSFADFLRFHWDIREFEEADIADNENDQEHLNNVAAGVAQRHNGNLNPEQQQRPQQQQQQQQQREETDKQEEGEERPDEQELAEEDCFTIGDENNDTDRNNENEDDRLPFLQHSKAVDSINDDVSENNVQDLSTDATQVNEGFGMDAIGALQLVPSLEDGLDVGLEGVRTFSEEFMGRHQQRQRFASAGSASSASSTVSGGDGGGACGGGGSSENDAFDDGIDVFNTSLSRSPSCSPSRKQSAPEAAYRLGGGGDSGGGNNSGVGGDGNRMFSDGGRSGPSHRQPFGAAMTDNSAEWHLPRNGAPLAPEAHRLPQLHAAEEWLRRQPDTPVMQPALPQVDRRQAHQQDQPRDEEDDENNNNINNNNNNMDAENNNVNNNDNMMDDHLDVELHVAVDELLGIRGPIHVLLRNLLWLLAFNCAYLGLFAFIPFSIGSSVVIQVRRFASFDLPVPAVGSNTFQRMPDFEDSVKKDKPYGTLMEESSDEKAQFGDLMDKDVMIVGIDDTGNLEYRNTETAKAERMVASTKSLINSVTSENSSIVLSSTTNVSSSGKTKLLNTSSSGSVRNIWSVLSEISATAAEEDHTLQLPDLATIALGYLMISLMVFMWRSIVSAVCRGVPYVALLGRIRMVLDCQAAVVKVGILLFLKMLLLPLLLGVCLDAATLTIFGSEGAERVRFTAQNLVGSLLLHWVLGITFMLFVTVSVLQLREVLHPDIFAAIIRPQEPHPDLLGSLLQESGATHARRMVMSLAIYIVLLFLFVWLPTALFEHFFPGALPVQLRLFYLVPQLQVPMELVIFHLSVLAFLERFKNHIGELQHIWLVYACKGLGLTRYLLPLPRLPSREANNPTAGAFDAARNMDPDPGPILGDGNDGDDELVGPPLQRPPPGWDDLAGGAQGRWAWGHEAPSQLELGLASRRRPSWVVPRLGVLFVGCWVTVLGLVLLGTAVPLTVGRALFVLLHTPRHLSHDPVAFAIGLVIAMSLKGPISEIVTKLLLRPMGALQQLRGLRRISRSFSACSTLVAFGTFWFGVTPLMLGVIFEASLVIPLETWQRAGDSLVATSGDVSGEEIENSRQLASSAAIGWAQVASLGRVSCFHLLQDWLLGIVLLHAWALYAYLGMLRDQRLHDEHARRHQERVEAQRQRQRIRRNNQHAQQQRGLTTEVAAEAPAKEKCDGMVVEVASGASGIRNEIFIGSSEVEGQRRGAHLSGAPSSQLSVGKSVIDDTSEASISECDSDNCSNSMDERAREPGNGWSGQKTPSGSSDFDSEEERECVGSQHYDHSSKGEKDNAYWEDTAGEDEDNDGPAGNQSFTDSSDDDSDDDSEGSSDDDTQSSSDDEEDDDEDELGLHAGSCLDAPVEALRGGFKEGRRRGRKPVRAGWRWCRWAHRQTTAHGGHFLFLFPVNSLLRHVDEDGHLLDWQARIRRAVSMMERVFVHSGDNSETVEGVGGQEGTWTDLSHELWERQLRVVVLWDLAIPVTLAVVQAAMIPFVCACLGQGLHAFWITSIGGGNGGDERWLREKQAQERQWTGGSTPEENSSTGIENDGDYEKPSMLWHFRHAELTCLLLCILSKCVNPICDAFTKLHDKIRDEQYLLGLELKDYHRPRPKMGTVSSNGEKGSGLQSDR